MISSYICFVGKDKIAFFFVTNFDYVTYTYHIFFIQWSVDEQLDWFHIRSLWVELQ